MTAVSHIGYKSYGLRILTGRALEIEPFQNKFVRTVCQGPGSLALLER